MNGPSIGDKVSWRGINRNYTGTVIRMDERGTLVSMESGKHILLPTRETTQTQKRRTGAPVQVEALGGIASNHS